MTEQQAKNLINRYRNGLCSAEEHFAIKRWIEEELSNQTWEISPEDKLLFGQSIKSRVDSLKNVPTKRFQLRSRYISAAILFFTLSAGLFFYTQHQKSRLDLSKNDVEPGGNKAILVLANGKRISLNDAKNGEVLVQDGVEITKSADGHLIYTLKEGDTQNTDGDFNTIETPRGGQYQVNLSDGSQVWLNSASTLKFPTSFAGLKNRKVELNGEAYFQVAKDKTRPFQVSDSKQIIEVLGTHFNVNNYADEASAITTLLEGSVLITPVKKTLKSITLKPNQQAELLSDHFLVKTVQNQDAIAWKKGYFMFNNEPLETIMAKVARWYAVDVTYERRSDRKITFFGSVSRFSNISKVLKVLELTGEVKFKIEGNKVTVIEE